MLGQVLGIDAHPGVLHVNDHPLAVRGRVGADWRVPPSSMAWMALMKRLRKTCCRLLLFAADGGRSAGRSCSTLMPDRVNWLRTSFKVSWMTVADGQRLKFRVLGAGEIQEAFDDLRGPVGLHQDVLDQPHGLFLGQLPKILLQGLGGEDDVIDGVVQFVGDPRGQGAHRGNLPGLHQLLLMHLQLVDHAVEGPEQGEEFLRRGFAARGAG